MTLQDEARDLQDDLVTLRRSLHAEPELGLQLPRTQEKVLAALAGLPLEISTGQRLSSVTAVLRGGAAGAAGSAVETVLLRGDMDALPVIEGTGLDYASRIDGRMHACGHDLHTAMLVGAARLLCARRAELAGDVVFMFQPGEEGHDGAALMISEGVLEASGARPVAAYALHVGSAMFPRGVFVTRRGPVLAASDQVRVTVRGRGGHGSAPHLARDPVPPACEMVIALQTQATRAFDPFDPIVVTVGAFHAGTACNVIPDRAVFEATVRSFSPEAHARIRESLPQLCSGIASGHGVAVEVDYQELYPVTVNDDAEAEFVAEVAADMFGEERFVWAPHPATGSEDFSRVLAEVPGAFVFLGACPPDRDFRDAPHNHSPLAGFDDAVLSDGAALLGDVAVRRLRSGPASTPG